MIPGSGLSNQSSASSGGATGAFRTGNFKVNFGGEITTSMLLMAGAAAVVSVLIFLKKG